MIESETARTHAEKIFSATQPGAVFAQPVTSGEQTIITASEVMAAGGYGYGHGTGPDQQGSGAGGGGGGFSSGRPVAAIVVSPSGVKIEPIVDVTKLAIAGVTVWGAMMATLIRYQRARRG